MHIDPNTTSVAETFAIVGMTCDHCVRAVTAELGNLDGVSHVEVDLSSGTATVQSAAPLDPADVAAAIDEAGYELAP
jgi:copper ion binding protein